MFPADCLMPLQNRICIDIFEFGWMKTERLVELTGNPYTSEEGGPEEAVQRVSCSGPIQRDEEARGNPLPQMVGEGRNRDGPQHRDMELQPGTNQLRLTRN